MDEILTYSISVFTGFFAIMNPVSNIPIFISLTEGASKAEKQKVNKKAVLVAFIIIAIFVMLGKFIFELFGITIPAFKITGGILIFFVEYCSFTACDSYSCGTRDDRYRNELCVSRFLCKYRSGYFDLRFNVCAYLFCLQFKRFYCAQIRKQRDLCNR